MNKLSDYNNITTAFHVWNYTLTKDQGKETLHLFKIGFLFVCLDGLSRQNPWLAYGIKTWIKKTKLTNFLEQNKLIHLSPPTLSLSSMQKSYLLITSSNASFVIMADWFPLWFLQHSQVRCWYFETMYISCCSNMDFFNALHQSFWTVSPDKYTV